MQNKPHELLGTNGVAELLGVHPKHVYRLLRRGLPAHRMGGEWRFDRQEVLDWVRAQPGRAAPRIERSREVAAPPLLAANGDVCIEQLLRTVFKATGQTIGFVQADHNSGRALVESGDVVAAGVHGTSQSESVTSMVQFHVTRRELGIASTKGKKLRSLADLAGLRLASRSPTAGARAELDRALLEHGLDPGRLHRRALVCASHRDVVIAVLSGKADAGLVTVAWADRAGLACLPFAEEDYRLCLQATEIAREPGRSIVRALQDPAIRKLLASTAGYDPRDAGALR